MQPLAHLLPQLSRRRFLARVGELGLTGLLGASAWDAMAESLVKLPFANGQRDLVANFPQKRAMLLQRTRPPLLETPFEVFDQGVFTPNDRFYVRWHLANIPSSIDPATFGLDIRGHVGQPIRLTLDELVRETKCAIPSAHHCRRARLRLLPGTYTASTGAGLQAAALPWMNTAVDAHARPASISVASAKKRAS